MGERTPDQTCREGQTGIVTLCRRSDPHVAHAWGVLLEFMCPGVPTPDQPPLSDPAAPLNPPPAAPILPPKRTAADEKVLMLQTALTEERGAAELLRRRLTDAEAERDELWNFNQAAGLNDYMAALEAVTAERDELEAALRSIEVKARATRGREPDDEMALARIEELATLALKSLAAARDRQPPQTTKGTES